MIASSGIGVLENLRHQHRLTGICNQTSPDLSKHPSNAKFRGNYCHCALIHGVGAALIHGVGAPAACINLTPVAGVMVVS
jgi:hypothetical protein